MPAPWYRPRSCTYRQLDDYRETALSFDTQTAMASTFAHSTAHDDVGYACKEAESTASIVLSWRDISRYNVLAE